MSVSILWKLFLRASAEWRSNSRLTCVEQSAISRMLRGSKLSRQPSLLRSNSRLPVSSKVGDHEGAAVEAGEVKEGALVDARRVRVEHGNSFASCLAQGPPALLSGGALGRL